MLFESALLLSRDQALPLLTHRSGRPSLSRRSAPGYSQKVGRKESVGQRFGAVLTAARSPQATLAREIAIAI